MGSLRLRLFAAFVCFAAAVAVALLFSDAPVVAMVIVAGLLVAGGVMLWLAAGVIDGSLRVISGAAREMSRGEFGTRLPTEEAGELAGAFNDLNAMARSFESRIAAASQERNRLTAAINSSVDGVLAIDEDGEVRFANNAAEVILGKDGESIVGHPLAWASAEREVIEGVRAAREEGTSGHCRIQLPDRRFFEVGIAPISGGGDWSTLVVFHDVTESKRTDDVRRDFVANVSHELRTPLSGVKSVIETLQGGAVENKEVALDFLQRAETETDRLVELVEELLALSRIESGQLQFREEPLNMAEVIYSAAERMRPYARQTKVELDIDVGGGPQEVIGDPEALERAVVNLIDNAIKFTPEGGKVSVASKVEGGVVMVAVTDSGAGIDSHDLPRVFERFYKADRARQRGGTGLGLAIVKHTVEAHGGSVGAESEMGRGSVFRFTLPQATSGIGS
jgi:two-component system phosphate regulon sensor histidine kinase PhoR